MNFLFLVVFFLWAHPIHAQTCTLFHSNTSSLSNQYANGAFNVNPSSTGSTQRGECFVVTHPGVVTHFGLYLISGGLASSTTASVTFRIYEADTSVSPGAP